MIFLSEESWLVIIVWLNGRCVLFIYFLRWYYVIGDYNPVSKRVFYFTVEILYLSKISIFVRRNVFACLTKL